MSYINELKLETNGAQIKTLHYDAYVILLFTLYRLWTSFSWVQHMHIVLIRLFFPLWFFMQVSEEMMVKLDMLLLPL